MSCQAKRSFKTEHEAQVALVEAVIARNRGNRKRKECRHYFCQWHGRWHLTSLPIWVEEEPSSPPS